MYICTAKQGSDGGIGRHAGLKILWPVMAVRVRFPLRVLKGVHQMMSTFSFYSERESFSRWHFGQLVYGRLKFARANYCLCRMNHFENKFSAIIRQIQQPSIASTSLRLPLNCCARSIPPSCAYATLTFQLCTLHIQLQKNLYLFYIIKL